MTRDRVRAAQTDASGAGVHAVLVTVAAIAATTVTVTLPGGASITCPRGAGWTYTVGGTGWALIQEPAVFAVIPTAN